MEEVTAWKGLGSFGRLEGCGTGSRDEWAPRLWERVLLGVRPGLSSEERRSTESTWEAW